MAEEEAFEEVPMSNALSKKLRNKLQSINEEDVSSPIEAKEMFRRRVNRVLMAFDVNKRLDISNEGHYIAKVVRKRVRMQALENQEAEAEALRAQLEKRQAELQEKARNEFSAPPQNQEAEAEAETLRAQLEKRQAELQEKAGN
ncbi:unnamed protein product [Cuscuta campestris]|uniref:Uncharacterized protein n=1 Tax=Cuscuta campestris TaxID=132261 RepID=A0A484KAS2_9ASTE|nr:unnamed protein product [Cuscuta campestris]